ncbi:uncharacterized protein V1516DRAFT_633175 [Lipomyces oligophaga]|uniref:uncharacterized protein n=1 Tax=Lipomyces oligophaga TaxID=45792 RepID=UPI0034CF258A
MDADGRTVVVWTGATAGLSAIALEQTLVDAAFLHTVSSGSLRHEHIMNSSVSRGRRRDPVNSSTMLSIPVTSVSPSVMDRSAPSLRVIVPVRDPESQNTINVLQRLRALGSHSNSIIESYDCDFSCFKAVRAFTGIVREKYQSISTIVLGAQITTYGPASFTDDEHVERGMTINYFSQWLLISAFSSMISHRIVLVASPEYKRADLSHLIHYAKRKSNDSTVIPEVPISVSQALIAMSFRTWTEYFATRAGAPKPDVLIAVPPKVEPIDVMKKRSSAIDLHLSMSGLANRIGFKSTVEQAADIITHAAFSPSFDGCHAASIGKDLKTVTINLRYLRPDYEEINYIHQRTRALFHGEEGAPTRPPAPPRNVPRALADTIKYWTDSETAKKYTKVDRNGDDDDENTRMSESQAYWNWTCMVTKEFQLIIHDED